MKKIHTLIKGFRSQHRSISSYDPRLHSVALWHFVATLAFCPVKYTRK